MILVTGVAGFIGSALASNLVARGETVIGVDDLSTGHMSSVPDGVDFILGDLAQPPVIKSLESKGNYKSIYHIAGQSGGEPSYDDPVRDLNSNTASTLLLLDVALKCTSCKFIYASTVSVYGNNGKSHLHLETDRCWPESFYGVGKLASEHYMRLYSEQFGLKTRALRLFNIYGPGQNLDNLRQGMVSIYLSQAIRSGKIIVKGAPDRYRDFVYIDDAVEAFLKADNFDGSGFFEFNISTGIETTVSDLCKALQNNLGEIDILYKGSTPGDIHGYTGEHTKALKLLGWKPKINLNKGLNTMVEWAKDGKFK